MTSERRGKATGSWQKHNAMRTSITVSTVILYTHAQAGSIYTLWDKMAWNETKRKATPGRASDCGCAAAADGKKEVQAAQQQQKSERAQAKEIQAERAHSQRERSTHRRMERERARAVRRVSERASKRPPVQTDRETGDHESERARESNANKHSEQRDQKGIVWQARERNRKGNEQNTKMQTQSKCMQKYCVFFAHALLFFVFPHILNV